ncbi:MAG: hypothetical protein RLZ81_2997 [Pseudomonadota bacterium]|jgi:adenosylcobinamide-GDP ribazoletransferase
MNLLRHYLLAVQFFTRIPVTGRLAHWVGFSPALLRASAAHFPGVGVLVGAVVACFTLALLHALPASPFAVLVAAALGTVLSVLITGGFHEDGLADVADGLGGSSERARVLEIMKDSRVGAFGAMALVLVLLSKVALLALLGSVDGGLMAVALFAAHVCSRTWPLLLIRCMPHVGDAAGSKSKPLADQISNASLLVALAWFAAAAALVLWLTEGVAWWAPVLASLLALLWLGRLLWRRLQGFTGDGLGATQQVCELAFYLGLAVTV